MVVCLGHFSWLAGEFWAHGEGDWLEVTEDSPSENEQSFFFQSLYRKGVSHYCLHFDWDSKEKVWEVSEVPWLEAVGMESWRRANEAGPPVIGWGVYLAFSDWSSVSLTVPDGQGSLACCSPWLAKSHTGLSNRIELTGPQLRAEQKTRDAVHCQVLAMWSRLLGRLLFGFLGWLQR